MAVDPKLAAGGVATVIIGGGTGYAITKTVNESKEESNQAPPRQPEGDVRTAEEKTKAANKAAMKAKLTEAKFEVDESDSDCNSKLEVEHNNDSFKAAVVACYKNKTLKDRAGKLGLTVLEISKLDESTENTDWKNKWTNKSTEIKALDSANSSSWNSITNAKDKVKEFCEPSSTISTGTNNEVWYKYLKICIKEDPTTDGESKPLTEALKNDFWTNKPTTTAGTTQ